MFTMVTIHAARMTRCSRQVSQSHRIHVLVVDHVAMRPQLLQEIGLLLSQHVKHRVVIVSHSQVVLQVMLEALGSASWNLRSSRRLASFGGCLSGITKSGVKLKMNKAESFLNDANATPQLLFVFIIFIFCRIDRT